MAYNYLLIAMKFRHKSLEVSYGTQHRIRLKAVPLIYMRLKTRKS